MPAAAPPERNTPAQPLLPALRQVERATLREQVVESVRSALMNGHFQPGQVVTVKSITEMLGASVMPAREAMNRLIAEGALELRPNRTVIVPLLSGQEFDELTDLRCHIEGQVAAQAVGRMTPADLERLRAIDEAMHRAGGKGDIDAYLDGNFRFHFGIYRLGASPFMLSIIEKLWVRAGPLIRACFNETGCHDASRHHANIVSHLAAGEGGALRQAIVADISVAAQTIRAVHAGRLQARTGAQATPSPQAGRGAVHGRQHGALRP